MYSFRAVTRIAGLPLRSEVAVALLSITGGNLLLFVGKFYQQQEISPVASRKNQAYSAITGVTGYGPLNDSPEL